MKILLALGLIGQVFSSSQDPHRPVVTLVSYEGDGCPTPRFDGDNFIDVGKTAEQKTCMMSVSLDLVNRCYESAKLKTLVYNPLLPGEVGTMVIRTSINDGDFSEPVSIALLGSSEPTSQENQTDISTNATRVCNGNTTLRVHSVLPALENFNSSLALLDQRVEVKVSELLGPEYSGPGPILEPIIFRGTGCSSPANTAIRANNWEVTIEHSDFDVSTGGSKSCQIFIPLDLHNGCLNSISRISDAYKAVDLYWSNFIHFNGATIVWNQQELLDDLTSGKRYLYQNPSPAICGAKLTLVIDTKITGKSGKGKSGGALKRQVFRVESIGASPQYSGTNQVQPTHQLFLAPLVLILLAQ